MIKTVCKIIACGLVLFTKNALAQPSIIPQPDTIVVAQNSAGFVLNNQTRLLLQSAALQPAADFFNDYLKQVYGFTLKSSRKPVMLNTILLKLKANKTNAGSYSLVVNEQGITIEGADEAGVFYGMQTLLQLLPSGKTTSLNIAALRIEDKPRFAYRGIMLDVGRHLFPVAFIKKYIDYAALHKLNYLHWHLTEDQGWRIEIKKYPKLAQVAAYRNGTIIGHHHQKDNPTDGKRYGGVYSQQEVREIVQYAASRYITVVPEIEMPGHSSAALAAYPSLGCTGGPYKVQQRWGIHKDVYCAGKEEVFTFLSDVLDEVMKLFPSPYIHVGGDECPKDRWKACARCQQRMKDHGLKDEHELQSYFIRRMEKYINEKGRTLIGWDEILEGGLAPNAVVMSWRGEKGGIEAARQQHEVIMTPNSHLYFDHYQGKASNEPLAIGGYTTLEKVYSYNPAPSVLLAAEQARVKGVQANLWTEYIAAPENVEYMSFPRMAALSEIAWTRPEAKNWEDFKRRMEAQYQRYESLGIRYAQSAFDVQPTIELKPSAGRATVSFVTESYAPEIYYTLDGSEPSVNAKLYRQPFELRKSTMVKAANFRNGKQVGKTVLCQVVL